MIDPDIPTKVNNLIDVIRDPNFDRYDFAYQSILSRKDFFNETCLKGVNKIYVSYNLILDGYIKNALAILRMVNARRSKTDVEPLRIAYNNPNKKRLSRTPGDPNLSFRRWYSTSAIKTDGGGQIRLFKF